MTDATVFQIGRPGPRIQYLWYDGKHGFHSVKIGTLNDARGKCRYLSLVYPGSVHDYHVWKLEDMCKVATMRTGDGADVELIVMADSGYQNKDTTQLYTPYKLTRGHPELTEEEKAFNTRLGSVRIIVEQSNGRLKQRFPIPKAKYIGARSGLTELIYVCAYFTNVDVDHHPLHAGDPAERDIW
jgi:RAB protein geranylgeranyltransferase component A